MVTDDTNYIPPHEAALAVVATGMKKARLSIDSLILNAFVGGFLFSTGSIMYLSAHAQSPDLFKDNPGILDLISSITFGIGLFYVVILGVDLFNSNILYFSVAFLHGSVTIFDVALSWIVSFFMNLGGALLFGYLFSHLTHISRTPTFIQISREIAEQKASYSFIETFLKGIGGNIFVCLAIYLQIMAKPIHVKFLLIVIPIFTLAFTGLTHVVADIDILFIGMLNGANVTVGEYIWKLLVPASIGNMLGGFLFSLVLPYYLHTVVVERDRKALNLPQYEAKDEQPDLNMDSRVVRIPKREAEENEEEAESESEDEENDPDNLYEKVDTPDVVDNSESNNHFSPLPPLDQSLLESERSIPSIRSDTDSSDNASRVIATRTNSRTQTTMPVYESLHGSTLSGRNSSLADNKSIIRKRARNRLRRKFRTFRTPLGVFPVRGMADPLDDKNSATEEGPYYDDEQEEFTEGPPRHLERDRRESNLARSRTYSALRGTPHGKHNENVLKRINTIAVGQRSRTKARYGSNISLNRNSSYNVLERKPGARLERALSRFVTRAEMGTETGSRKHGSNSPDIEMNPSKPRHTSSNG